MFGHQEVSICSDKKNGEEQNAWGSRRPWQPLPWWEPWRLRPSGSPPAQRYRRAPSTTGCESSEDHVTWTRLVIVDVAFGTADTQATLERLLQNQVDIGNAIKPFYGDAAGSQLTALLTTHIVLAGNILVNAKAGNTDGVNANVTLWYQNANDIAAFLNGANPTNWPLADIQMMMKTHLDLTLQEAVAQLTGDYSTSISTYDQVHLEILQMADMLSAGIIAQFPSMFTGPNAM